jgi:hypothetical protein
VWHARNKGLSKRCNAGRSGPSSGPIHRDVETRCRLNALKTFPIPAHAVLMDGDLLPAFQRQRLSSLFECLAVFEIDFRNGDYFSTPPKEF